MKIEHDITTEQQFLQICNKQSKKVLFLCQQSQEQFFCQLIVQASTNTIKLPPQQISEHVLSILLHAPNLHTIQFQSGTFFASEAQLLHFAKHVQVPKLYLNSLFEPVMRELLANRKIKKMVVPFAISEELAQCMAKNKHLISLQVPEVNSQVLKYLLEMPGLKKLTLGGVEYNDSIRFEETKICILRIHARVKNEQFFIDLSKNKTIASLKLCKMNELQHVDRMRLLSLHLNFLNDEIPNLIHMKWLKKLSISHFIPVASLCSFLLNTKTLEWLSLHLSDLKLSATLMYALQTCNSLYHLELKGFMFRPKSADKFKLLQHAIHIKSYNFQHSRFSIACFLQLLQMKHVEELYHICVPSNDLFMQMALELNQLRTLVMKKRKTVQFDPQVLVQHEHLLRISGLELNNLQKNHLARNNLQVQKAKMGKLWIICERKGFADVVFET